MLQLGHCGCCCLLLLGPISVIPSPAIIIIDFKREEQLSSLDGEKQEAAVKDLSARLIIRPRLRYAWPFGLPNQSKKRASLRFQGQNWQAAIK